MKADLLNLVNVLATPTDVFCDIKEKPRWLTAFFGICIISMAIVWSYGPVARHLAFMELSWSMTEQEIESFLARKSIFRYLGIGIIPFKLLVKWSIMSTTIFLFLILLETNTTSFKHVFTVVVYSEVILVLMSLFNVLLVYARGIDSIESMKDLEPLIGLHLLVTERAAKAPLIAVLSKVNPFTIWYVATLAIGVSAITNFSKGRSALLVSSVWFFGIGLQVLLTTLF